MEQLGENSYQIALKSTINQYDAYYMGTSWLY